MNSAQALASMIDRSPTAYHAVLAATDTLTKAGFQELHERDLWDLKPGDRCFVVRNASSLVAFVVGEVSPADAGCLIVGAHTDSPHFKIKPAPTMFRNGCSQLSVEPYGGMLLSTWMDRDLSIAGRVVISEQSQLRSVLIDWTAPVMRIPNLAVHLDREVNTRGLVLNKQTHMVPIVGLGNLWPAEGSFAEWIAAQVRRSGQRTVQAGDVLDFDLIAYDTQKASLGGQDDCFLFAGRIDNLACCHAALSGLVGALDRPVNTAATRMIALWDNEECGSQSAQGAHGPLLAQVMQRIADCRCGDGKQAMARTTARSFLVSADMAHAVHPNYSDRHDPAHSPLLGGGPVIKINAGQSYATDGESAARFTQICRRAGHSPQRFVVRSDLPGGSTIGPITAALLGIKTVDVGSPMLSMHSIREMIAVADHDLMIAALTEYFC